MPNIDIELALPHQQQRQVLDEAERFNVLECGRRFGKTTLGEIVAANAAIAGKRVGWFAPTYRTLGEQWKAIERTLRPVIQRINKVEQQITILGGGVIDFWSLDNPDSGRGRKYHTVIIDEASIVRSLQDAWEGSIRPTLADYRGSAWFLGTPKGRGYFHKLFRKGQDGAKGWKSWRFKTIDNPLMHADEIEDARRDLPVHVFLQEFEGIPADDGGNPFGIAAIEKCVQPLSTDPPVCFGVDLAKSKDWTVVIGLDAEGRVCHFERFQSDWGSTERRVLQAVGEHPTLVDSTGVGDPIVERMQLVRSNIEGFHFSSTSKQSLMEGLASAIQRQAVTFPEGEIAEELKSFEYEYTKRGVKYEAAQGLHDDTVCAIALAYRKLAAPQQFVGYIEAGDESTTTSRADMWH